MAWITGTVWHRSGTSNSELKDWTARSCASWKTACFFHGNGPEGIQTLHCSPKLQHNSRQPLPQQQQQQQHVGLRASVRHGYSSIAKYRSYFRARVYNIYCPKRSREGVWCRHDASAVLRQLGWTIDSNDPCIAGIVPTWISLILDGEIVGKCMSVMDSMGNVF